MGNNNYYIVNLQQSDDDRGSLVVCEINRHMPFEARRFFSIYGTQSNVIRGNHANRNSRFFMVCVQGSCQIDVDDGKTQANFYMDNNGKALYVNRMVWKTMRNFSPDCILLILSDCIYDENEYVFEYNTFKNEVQSS